MIGESMQTTSKVWHGRVYQLMSQNRSSHYASLPVLFNPLPTSTNREVRVYMQSKLTV